MTDHTHYTETRLGFEFGSVTVERVVSHKGHVVIVVVTPKERLRIRVTPSGMIRLNE